MHAPSIQTQHSQHHGVTNDTCPQRTPGLTADQSRSGSCHSVDSQTALIACDDSDTTQSHATSYDTQRSRSQRHPSHNNMPLPPFLRHSRQLRQLPNVVGNATTQLVRVKKEGPASLKTQPSIVTASRRSGMSRRGTPWARNGVAWLTSRYTNHQHTRRHG